MRYLCPVCGYDKLEYPPHDYSICPCCRTEFGVSDRNWSHNDLRQDWIARGANWGSILTPRPANWNFVKQLLNIYDTLTQEEQLFVRQNLHEASKTASGTITVRANFLNIITFSVGISLPEQTPEPATVLKPVWLRDMTRNRSFRFTSEAA